MAGGHQDFVSFSLAMILSTDGLFNIVQMAAYPGGKSIAPYIQLCKFLRNGFIVRIVFNRFTTSMRCFDFLVINKLN
jgi:hypothetical protein